MQNYAEVLESYLIPAEEGFGENVGNFFKSNEKAIKIAIGTVVGAILTIAGVRTAMKTYKTNRIFAPYLPAKAISVILGSKKYDSVQYNTNIFELLKTGTEIVQKAEPYYNELNKACLNALMDSSYVKDSSNAIIALKKLTEYFNDACDSILSKIASGEEVMITKEDAELGDLEDSLKLYINTCDQMFVKQRNIYNAFSTERKEYVGNGNYNVSKRAPEFTLQVTLDGYGKALDRFHETIINIKIKRK